MRQVVLDTETTGISPKQGHRIIEIGCIELVGRRLTGNHYHEYVNPDREIEAEAIGVHGITNEFLDDKPRFKDIYRGFLEFVDGAELIIHNAPFDVGFLNHELSMLKDFSGRIEDYCGVFDTLALARSKHPGQRNTLDALCSRYGVNNTHRTLHGALLDSEILADVYLLMTGGQSSFSLEGDEGSSKGVSSRKNVARRGNTKLKIIRASESEMLAHEQYLEDLAKGGSEVIWRQYD